MFGLLLRNLIHIIKKHGYGIMVTLQGPLPGRAIRFGNSTVGPGEEPSKACSIDPAGWPEPLLNSKRTPMPSLSYLLFWLFQGGFKVSSGTV